MTICRNDAQIIRRWIRGIFWLSCLALGFVGQGWNPVESARADEKEVTAADGDTTAFEETWQVIYIGKTRVGYGRSSVARKTIEGEDLVVTDTEMSLSISRFGQSVKSKTIIQTDETPDGDLVEFRCEMQNPPAAPTRSTGRVKDDMLLLTTETNGKTKTRELPWDNSLKSPAYQDRMLRESPLKAKEKRTLKTFDPQFGKANTVTLEATIIKNVALLEGKTKKLLEVTGCFTKHRSADRHAGSISTMQGCGAQNDCQSSWEWRPIRWRKSRLLKAAPAPAKKSIWR